MLTETSISTILQASITGAGLILAIYALIIPMSRRVFEERAEKLRKRIEEFKTQQNVVAHASTEDIDKEFKKLKKLKDEIDEIKIFPKYLGIGVGITFFLFMISTLTSSGLLLNEANRLPENEAVVSAIFLMALISFALVGITSVGDIALSMKKQFEKIKKEQEQVKQVHLSS